MQQDNLKRELSTLDENGIDLMTQLLCSDPEKRPTAEEALAHPFLSRNGTERGQIATAVSEPLGRELNQVAIMISRESQDQEPIPSRKHVRLDAWATLVDYVVEIVEVFDLRIDAAFRAMNYFDHFFSSYQGSVSFAP